MREQHIGDILEALEYCYFDELCNCESFESDVVEPFTENYKGKFDYASGATKGVLIFKDFGFVIKIPYIYDEDEMIPFTGAYLTEDKWNYCEQEEKVYETISKEEDFKRMFLKTEYLDTVNGHPIYIQNYAESIHNNYIKYGSSHTEEDSKCVENLIEENKFFHIDTDWEADILKKYGREFYINFKKNMIKYKIDDIREANIGYYNNYPVIIDYAGFNE